MEELILYGHSNQLITCLVRQGFEPKLELTWKTYGKEDNAKKYFNVWLILRLK